MKKVTANGYEYKVTGNPDMRTVKYVNGMEIMMMRKYVSDGDIMKFQDKDQDELMAELLEDAGLDELKDIMWERSLLEPIQTIALATNEQISSEDIDEMSALNYKELKEASEDALGGSASDFIDTLDIGISSKVKALQEEAGQLETEQTDDALPPSVSNLSS